MEDRAFVEHVGTTQEEAFARLFAEEDRLKTIEAPSLARVAIRI
jgi:hypothetical protein